MSGEFGMDLDTQARLLELAHDAIIIRDLDGKISYWNEGAAKKYGWTKEEAVGRNLFQLLQPVFPEPLEAFQEKLATDRYWEGDVAYTRRDKKQVTVFSRQTVAPQSGAGPPVVLQISHNITGQKETAQALRDLVGHLLETHEQERWRISRELHDHTSQSLTGVLSRLHTLLGSTLIPAPSRKLVSECLQLAEDASGYVRKIASKLHPTILDERGLAAAIRWYAEGVSSHAGLHFEIKSPAENPRLAPDTERSVYRLAQEIITWLRLSSSSGDVKIQLASDAGQFTLEVTCEEVTPAVEHLDPDIARLLATEVEERVKQIGGKVEISPTDSDAPIYVRAVLPLAAA